MTVHSMNPDCLSGKHRACRGDAFDFVLDQLSDCMCDCHKETP